MLGLLTVAAACGDNGASSPSVTVKFVGNASCPADNTQPYSPSPPNTNGPAVGEAIDEMPHTHVQPPAKVTYNHDPPTSGCHYNLGTGVAPISPGAYDRVVAPEYWVHNLEHGYVVVLYNCPLGCATDFQSLRTWLKGLPPDPGGVVSYAKVLVLPWPSMKSRFAAVSWDWYQGYDRLDMSAIQKFYDSHVNQAPEGPGAA